MATAIHGESDSKLCIWLLLKDALALYAGLEQSLGVMVNYVYDLKTIERNHERFVNGVTEASRQGLGLLA